MIVSFKVTNKEDLDLLLRLTKRLGIQDVTINHSNSTAHDDVSDIAQDIEAVFGTQSSSNYRLPFE